MNRTTVLLLFGGESSEHDVSLSSARNVVAAIDTDKFDIVFGYIDRNGTWRLLEKFDDFSDLADSPQLAPILGSGAFVTIPGEKNIKPDVILPVLHGKNGEDGAVAALGQLLHIPVVGCDMTAGALCMDKVATKEILAQHGVNVAPFRTYLRGDSLPSYDELASEFGDTLFVKPSRSGSSVGVSKVTTADELQVAINLALESDDTVLIEKAIVGRELETAALGNPPTHEISGVGEVVQGETFYTYDEKYSENSTSNVVIPAELDPEMAEKIRTVARDAYQILGCRGLARIDFFLADDETIYINEINTFPGFTDISMYPKLWEQAGVSYPELINRLISLAISAS